MRYLLDTHTFLWFVTADDQMSEKARHRIEDVRNDVYLSVGSPGGAVQGERIFRFASLCFPLRRPRWGL